jgi:hypothetical protein
MRAPHERPTTRSRGRAAELVAAVVLATIAIAAPRMARADSIYLTNGRVIHTEHARIEGDRVIFRQYGGEVSIPRSAVLRIVDNDEAERSEAREPVEAGSATGADPAASDTTTPPQPSRDVEYWAKLIIEVDQRIDRVQAELDRLPHYDAADRFILRYSGQALYFIAERDKWEAMMRRFELTRRQLLEGARKAGIPPGALRDALAG